jgi:hypothetical protein
MQLRLFSAVDRPADQTDRLWIGDSGRPLGPQIVNVYKLIRASLFHRVPCCADFTFPSRIEFGKAALGTDRGA